MINATNSAPMTWLDVPTAAQHAALSQRSIRRLILRGQLTAHRPVRGRIVISRMELDQLIASSVPQPRKGRGRKQAS